MKEELEKLLSERDYSMLYRAVRTSGNNAPDEELVKYLLSLLGGYQNWDKLTATLRDWVIAKIKG